MTTSTETPTVIGPPPSNSSGLARFFRFLGRLILAFLKLLPVFILIIALLAAAWLGFQELNRSFGVVNGRIDRNNEQISQLRSELSTASVDLSKLQFQQSALAADITEVDGRISAANDDLSRQNEMLAALEEQVVSLEDDAESSAANIVVLGEGLNDLQNDVTTNGGQIDDLGGQIDALAIEANMLGDDIAANSAVLAQKEAIVVQLSKTLTLFRIWETVARARLHLVDQNIGLAQADIETAGAVIDQMAADETGDLADALGQMQIRLGLAAGNLPDDPEAAVRDLNTVWETLDAALTQMLAEASEAAPAIAEPGQTGE